MNYVDFQVKAASADEALKYDLRSSKAVVVNGNMMMAEHSFDMQKLEEVIRGAVEE
jgi:hypothetical protein